MDPEISYEQVVAASIVAGPYAVIYVLKALNFLSYDYLKTRILQQQQWDLNICCGRTDGGGINADIYKHADLPNFVHIDNIYSLPFKDKQFYSTLCSHTMEHVGDPIRFYKELQRVSQRVVIVVPPLWDISAALNILEHKYIFLTLRKKHAGLPLHVRFPFAAQLHRRFGQRMHA